MMVVYILATVRLAPLAQRMPSIFTSDILMERVRLHKLKTQTRAFDRTDRSDTHVVTARRLDQDDAALDGHIAHARGQS